MSSNAALQARRTAAIPRGIATAYPVFAERAEGSELWDKDGEFTPSDEAIVVQLAQMAANAIETLELLSREHQARVEAEETGRRLLREGRGRHQRQHEASQRQESFHRNPSWFDSTIHLARSIHRCRAR